MPDLRLDGWQFVKTYLPILVLPNSPAEELREERQEVLVLVAPSGRAVRSVCLTMDGYGWVFNRSVN